MPTKMTRDQADRERRTDDAVRIIASAAERATGTIAEAAAAAAKVVSNAAIEASKVSHAQQSNDHDLLVELRTKMEDLKVAIVDLKDGTSHRIDSLEHDKLNIKDSYTVVYRDTVEKMFKDHEDRLRMSEYAITRILTVGTTLVILIGVINIVVSLYLKSR